MRLTIDKEELLGALDNCVAIAKKRTTLDVTQHVCLRLSGDSLELSATDLKQAALVTLSVDGAVDGSVRTNAAGLAERVRSIPTETISLAVKKGGTLAISGPKCPRKHSVSTFPADDFPELPTVPEATFLVGSDELNAIVDQVVSAAYTLDDQPGLNGVKIERLGDTVSAVATDSRRAHMATRSAGEGADAAFTVPSFAIGAFRKFISRASGGLEIAVTNKHVFVSHGSATFITNTNDSGRFPPVEKILRKCPEGGPVAGKSPLSESISAMAIAAGEDQSWCVRLNFGKALALSSGNPGHSDACDKIVLLGDELNGSTRVNPDYLKDSVKALSGDEAKFGLGENNELWIHERTDDGTYTAMILPMR